MPRWSGGTITYDAGSIVDQHISSSAAIDADKMQHVHKAFCNFGLEYNATPAAKVFVVYTATAAGTIRDVGAGLYDTGTSTSITFDLKKNGVSVLSSVITVTHSDSDRATVNGTLSGTSFADGDVFTMHLATSSTTGAQGPFMFADFEENSAP